MQAKSHAHSRGCSRGEKESDKGSLEVDLIANGMPDGRKSPLVAAYPSSRVQSRQPKNPATSSFFVESSTPVAAKSLLCQSGICLRQQVRWLADRFRASVTLLVTASAGSPYLFDQSRRCLYRLSGSGRNLPDRSVLTSLSKKIVALSLSPATRLAECSRLRLFRRSFKTGLSYGFIPSPLLHAMVNFGVSTARNESLNFCKFISGAVKEFIPRQYNLRV